MNQDRGFSRAPRTVHVLLKVLVAVALIALGSVVSVPAAGADGEESAAAWPVRWTEYTQRDGTPIGDVDGDVTPSTLDLASGDCPTCEGPAHTVAWASDRDNAFFRMRLATDISGTTEEGSPGEAFLVRIADTSGHVQAVVGVNRTAARHTVYVADADGDVVIEAYDSRLSAANQSSVGARVVPAADGSGQFFLDFQVPLRLISTVSGGAIDRSTPIALYYGSSAGASATTHDLSSITADFMLGSADVVDYSTLATIRLDSEQHRVTYDSTGGSGIAASTVADGFAVEAPTTPTRVGHTFIGWFTSAADGPTYDFGAAVTDAMTLHARWDADRFQVTFDSMGGSAVADQTVRYGDTVTAVADPTRRDDTFLGWFTAATGGKAQGAQPVTGPTALYAQWRVNDTTLESGSDPGDGAPPVADDAPAVSSRQPSPQPRSLDTAADGGAVKRNPEPRRGATAPRGRSTQSTHPVVFYPNGGSRVDPQTVASGDTAAVPAEPTRAGYAFEGWFATADGNAEWDFTKPIDKATTLYAHWTAAPGGADEDTDCADYATSAEATEAMGPGDPDRLDGDNDGIACENSLPAGGSGDTGDDAGQDGGRNGDAELPNTGNQVPAALLPVAYLLLLLGLVLMTGDRRRLRGAAPGPA